MQNKSQIKFGETIGILFIVYIVLVFGIMWYNNKNSDDLEEMQLQNAQDSALEKYYYVIYSDLLRTSQRGYEKNSFDLLSIKSFANYSKTEEGKYFLQGRLGEAVITLDLYEGENVYDDEAGDSFDSMVLYNNTPSFRENSQIRRSQVFTSLIPLRRVQGDEEEIILGVMRVEVPSYS